MHAHAERTGMPSPKRIVVAGKATENKHILGLIASIFGGDIYTKGWSGMLSFTLA